MRLLPDYKVWAIRHKPSGEFVHLPDCKSGNGFSFWEPGQPTRRTPVARLFKSERAAKAALTQWLRGVHEPVMEWEYDEYSDRDYQVTVGTSVEPQSHRKREDMEIVCFQLKEIHQDG